MEKESRFAKSTRKMSNLALAALYLRLAEARLPEVDDVADYKIKKQCVNAHRREALKIANHEFDITNVYFANNCSFEGLAIDEFDVETVGAMELILSGHLDSAKKRVKQWAEGLIDKFKIREKLNNELAPTGSWDNVVSSYEQKHS